MSRILVIDDDQAIAELVKVNLELLGHVCTTANDGIKGLALAQQQRPDMVVLDVMMPDLDGYTVAQRLRQNPQTNGIPILMLTARGRPEDVLNGFGAGADDYLPKPFDLAILLARLNGLLRRMAWHRPEVPVTPAQPERSAGSPSTFAFAGRTIDFASLELTTPDKTIRLTLMESDLLRYLVLNQGRIISRKELLEQVWRVREDTDTRAIDNFMVRLRRYIEDNPAEPVFLETVRGVGYRFLPGVSAS